MVQLEQLPQDYYYKTTEVASRLKISRSTVLRYSKDGRLPPPVRLTKSCIRWSKKELDAFLEGSVNKPT
jgi:excisionase family DNA binding protein